MRSGLCNECPGDDIGGQDDGNMDASGGPVKVMKYRTEIDGLRAIAVLSVVLCHAGLPWLAGGYAGVDVFFVISGFLITRILIDDLATGRFSLGRFYERRARRILPALVVMALTTVPFAYALMVPVQFQEYAETLIGVALFLPNIALYFQTGYFENEAALKPLLHTWSLGVEEQFYVFYPLLVWALVRQGGLRWITAALALLTGLSLVAAQRGTFSVPDAAFYFLPYRAWELLAGGLAALAVREGQARADDRLALPGLLMVIAPMVLYDETYAFPGLWALPPVAGTALVLAFGRAGTRAARLLSLPPLVWVGLISYSLYLWHQPLFAFARLMTGDDPVPPVMAGLVLASIGLGWASWRWIETPFRGATPLLAARRRLFAAATVSIAVTAATGLGLIASGIEPRRASLPGVVSLAELKAIKKQRNDLIRNGPCHLRAGGKPEQFLRDWSCRGDGTAGLRPSGLAIYGDSHAADRAGAIRRAGHDILQLTAAGCPLLPGDGPRPYCDANLEAFHAHAAQAGVRAVILANRYQPAELTPAALQAIVDYWTSRYDRVYLFSPAPLFQRFGVLVQIRPLADLARMHPDESLRREFLRNIAEVDLKGAIVLDSYAYFCGTEPGCSPVGEGPLLVDEGHMSPEGMTAFGRRLADDPAGPLGRP